jgi:outer membrane protein assembly factor BamB
MATKFGWMEIMVELLWQSHKNIISHGHAEAIVPLVLIPLTAITVALTSIAGVIAGWFGIKLHTEGPKQFLEVLLKKRVLISMLIVNFTGLALYKSYVYIKTMPRFISTIQKHSKENAIGSNEIYQDALFREHNFNGKITNSNFNKFQLEKEIKLPKGAFRSGVISGSSIFYGNDDGNIYEINKADLAIKRKFYIGTPVTTRPIIFKDRIFSGEGTHDTHHARIYSFNLKTGSFINSFTTKGHTEGQPLIGNYNGRYLMFITAGSDGLYALDPFTMREIWHQQDGHLDASVSLENGIVYVGTGIEKGSVNDKRYAVAYDFNNGNRIWKKELPLSNWMHPVITKKYVCYSLGEIYFANSTGLFDCLDKKTGEPIFSIPFDGPLASLAFYIRDGENELVFIGKMNDEVCSIDINNRTKKWCQSVGKNGTKNSMTSFDYDSKNNILLYPSFKNGIFAFDPLKGSILFHWLPQKIKWEDNYASATIENNIFYQMDIEGNLRKFKMN